MKKNLVLFMILIVVAAAPAGAVRAEGEDTDAKIESGVTSFFPRAWAWIVDHTPAFIQNSIRSAYAVTEDFRLDLDRKLDAKKTDLEAELVILDAAEKGEHPTFHERLLPVAKHIEHFFTGVFDTVLGSQILFYGLSFLIVLWAIRYLIRLIF